MKPLTTLYLKAFLWTGLPYGLVMVGFDIAEGHGFRVWRFLFLTVFFGIFMSLTLVSFHRHRLKKNGIQKVTSDDLRVSQQRVVTAGITQQTLVEELKNDPIIGKMKRMESENEIVIRSGITWKSWGEHMKITMSPVGENQWNYVVSSSPRVKPTIVDYGKNVENVNRIEQLITSIT